MVQLSVLSLDPSNDRRRNFPPEFSPGRDAHFDALTIFYDCLKSADGSRIIFLGPPLANLETEVVAAIRRVFNLSGEAHPFLLNTIRHSYMWLPAQQICDDLPSGIFRQDRIVVQPNLSDVFSGKRVLFSLSKDNELLWIKDWVYFYARKHGCDAVLLYDNASTAYNSAELSETIGSIPGIKTAIVVDWPFPYGVTGYSNFSQFGMLEHARRRFLAFADGAVNADVDELIITSDGSSIFDLLRQSRTGYLRYNRRWIENASNVSHDKRRRYKDYVYFAHEIEPLVRPKWAIVPSRCPEEGWWRVHGVDGVQPDLKISGKLLARHFKAINTNWKDERSRAELPENHNYRVDDELVKWLQIFDDSF